MARVNFFGGCSVVSIFLFIRLFVPYWCSFVHLPFIFFYVFNGFICIFFFCHNVFHNFPVLNVFPIYINLYFYRFLHISRTKIYV